MNTGRVVLQETAVPVPVISHDRIASCVSDGTESGESCEYDQPPFIYPAANGYIDQNGICYINGVAGFEPFPGFVLYNTAPVCYNNTQSIYQRRRGAADNDTTPAPLYTTTATHCGQPCFQHPYLPYPPDGIYHQQIGK